MLGSLYFGKLQFEALGGQRSFTKQRCTLPAPFDAVACTIPSAPIPGKYRSITTPKAR